MDLVTATKIDEFLEKLTACADGKMPFTFVMRDPSGNSFVENKMLPAVDPRLSVVLFTRSGMYRRHRGGLPTHCPGAPRLCAARARKRGLSGVPRLACPALRVVAVDENAELGITLDQSSDQVFVEPEPEPEPETAAAAGASPDEEKVGVVPRQVEGGKKYTAGGTTGGGNNRETYNGTFVEGAGDRAGPDFSGAKAAGEEGVHTDDKYYVPEEDIAVFDELCYACGPPARPRTRSKPSPSCCACPRP